MPQSDGDVDRQYRRRPLAALACGLTLLLALTRCRPAPPPGAPAQSATAVVEPGAAAPTTAASSPAAPTPVATGAQSGPYNVLFDASHAFDFLVVELRDPAGKTLQVVQRLSDGSSLEQWQHTTAGLTGYAGRKLVLVFTATSGKIRPTKFFIDDVSVTAQ